MVNFEYRSENTRGNQMLYFITVLHFLSSGLELCLECAVCSRPVPLAADRDKLGILQDDRDARTVRNSEAPKLAFNRALGD